MPFHYYEIHFNKIVDWCLLLDLDEYMLYIFPKESIRAAYLK